MADKKESEPSVEAKNEGLVSHLLSIFKKLTPGQDLSTQSISMPEGFEGNDSGLERLQSASLCHSDILLKLNDIDDPVLRLIQIIKWYFTTGQMLTLKKPLNPVLGEVSMCKYYSNQPNEGNKNDGKSKNDANNEVFYALAEMISHHPPISAYMLDNKERGIRAEGYQTASVKFVGTAIRVVFNAVSNIYVDKLKEVYTYSPPNVVVHFIGFVVEYSGKIEIACSSHPYVARITYKEKPWLRGKYHRVKGSIVKVSGNEKAEEVVVKFQGHWKDKVEFEDLRNKQVYIYSASDYPPGVGVPTYPAFEDELPNSSRKVWHYLKTAANSAAAAKAKREVEEEQRRKAKERAEKKEEHKPKYFIAEQREGGIIGWKADFAALSSIAF